MKKQEFTSREIHLVQDALKRRHTHFLNEGESFEIEGFQSVSEVYVKFTLHNKDDSLFYPVEARVDPRTLDLSRA